MCVLRVCVFGHIIVCVCTCTGRFTHREQKRECFLQDFSIIFLPAKNWCGVLIAFGLLGPVRSFTFSYFSLCFYLQLLSHLLIILVLVVHHHPRVPPRCIYKVRNLVAFKKLMPDTYLFRKIALGEMIVFSPH